MSQFHGRVPSVPRVVLSSKGLTVVLDPVPVSPVDPLRDMRAKRQDKLLRRRGEQVLEKINGSRSQPSVQELADRYVSRTQGWQQLHGKTKGNE